VWAAICLALVSLPFLVVDFIPCTDLPQHLGQLRLFAQAWGDPGGPLTIQWWTPYSLVYALLALPWSFLPPLAAGRVGVWLIVVLLVGLVHLAAAHWQRPISAAVLATVFVFNSQLYWGFLNFLFGAIVFAIWFLLTRREDGLGGRAGVRTAGLFFLVATLLYFAHALWFAFGLVWLAVEGLIGRRSWRSVAWRGLGIAPAVIGALWWFAFLRASSFVSAPEWQTSFIQRLGLVKFTHAALGGLSHPVEVLMVAGALLWVAAALVSGRRQKLWGCEPYLLTLALMFLTLYLVLPTKYATTIAFNIRWLPFCLVSLLLAVGPLALRRPLRRATACVLLVTYMVVTTAVWRAFEATELTGLAEALAAMKGEPRVVGLSYLGQSRFVHSQPFVQIFSWAYALHGGALSFSFGDFPTSLVVYKDMQRRVWTPGLEWIPKAVRRSDFQYFDYALVGGDESAQRTMQGLAELEPVVSEGIWRLYRIDSSSDDGQ
jgi:hypothetical protein